MGRRTGTQRLAARYQACQPGPAGNAGPCRHAVCRLGEAARRRWQPASRLRRTRPSLRRAERNRRGSAGRRGTSADSRGRSIAAPGSGDAPPPALPEEEVPAAPEPAISLPDLAEPRRHGSRRPPNPWPMPGCPAARDLPRRKQSPRLNPSPRPNLSPGGGAGTGARTRRPRWSASRHRHRYASATSKCRRCCTTSISTKTREHVATLQANLGQETVPGNEVIRAAHTTASISAATGILPISGLARALEDALGRLALIGATPTEAQRYVFRALCRRPRRHARRRRPAPHAGRRAGSHRRAEGDEPGHRAGGRSPAAPVTATEVAAKAASIAATPAVTGSHCRRRGAGGGRPPSQRCRKSRSAPPTVARHGWKTRSTFQILPLFLEESVDLMRDIGETLRQWRADPTNAEVAKIAAALSAHPEGQRADGGRHGLR
jgi:hypothetical protein